MFFKTTPSSPERTRVKICGLQTVKTAQLAVDSGADAIGLVFYKPSPRCVTLSQANKIALSVDRQIDIIGVFVNPSREEVEQTIRRVNLTGLQFHGNESKDFCTQWPLPWLKAIHIDEQTDIKSQIQHWPESFACLLDTKTPSLYGGAGKQFNWQKIPTDQCASIVLSGGLNPDNVAEAMALEPFALDVSSGVEYTRGIKSITLIKAFMKEVHNVQNRH